jgi:hypothetical protein
MAGTAMSDLSQEIPTHELLAEILIQARADSFYDGHDPIAAVWGWIEQNETVIQPDRHWNECLVRIQLDGLWWEAEHRAYNDSGNRDWFDWSYPGDDPELTDIVPLRDVITLYRVEPVEVIVTRTDYVRVVESS